MKKITAILIVLSSIKSAAQVGINTTTPTKTLDVNGEMRVRTMLSSPQLPNAVSVVSLDANNVLQNSTAFDVLFSSTVYVKQTSPNNWNNIHFGGRVTRLDFVGQASVAGNSTGLVFSLFYDIGSGFKTIETPVASGTSSVSIIPVNSTTFNIIINGETFRATVNGATGLGTIQITNTNNHTISGTFVATSEV